MTKQYKISLFIFRRDLRLTDNTSLMKAIEMSDRIIPLFILTPVQVSEKNKFKSSNSIQFMIESLYDLDKQCQRYGVKLLVMYGDEIQVINKIYNEIFFDAIHFNRDYTPYALKRDKLILKFCQKNGLGCHNSHDCLLTDTLDISAKNGNRYTVFGQYYNNVSSIKIRPVMKINKIKFYHVKIKDTVNTVYTIESAEDYLLKNNFYEINDHIAESGGRKECQKILRSLARLKTYENTHNIPSIRTTMLSAHNKFGTCSIREIYYAIKEKTNSHTLLRQLYWRDFYYYIGYHFPNLYTHEHLTKDVHVDNSEWEQSKVLLNAWKNGMTGFPIVDAGMRELNNTGFMHNRCRLIVSMFLCKDLLINWKYGEEYFSQKLVDIDRAQNVGNWNWSSSYGLDHTSFLRIFNPWTQAKEFDPNCIYIKKWIPELSDVENDHILNWNKYYSDYDIDYPKPIVEHDVKRLEYLKFYKRFFR
jgi:deoxyribodipyrimidine photo-lyase